MTYDKILWIDDDPSYTLSILQLLELHGQKKDSLSPRIEFAHDALEGAAKIGEKYDLIILDGDFPIQLDPQHRLKVERLIARYRAGDNFNSMNKDLKELGMDPTYGEHDWGRFNQFYLDHAAQISNTPVVVHSMSYVNMIPALLLGLPFYSKELPVRTNLQEYLQDSIRTKDTGRNKLSNEQISILQEKKFEFGTFFQFIQHYFNMKV